MGEEAPVSVGEEVEAVPAEPRQEEVKVAATSAVPAVESGTKELPQYMHDAVARIAPEQGFTPGQFKIDFEVGSGKGDGFVGEMFRARITEGARELVVLCKIPPINEARRQQFGSMVIFEREVEAYSKLLPAMYEFQREKGVTEELDVGFFNAPKCYLSYWDGPKEESAILMDDLRLRGYRMWNKMIPVNYEHARLLMVQLGRLHAVSFAMKDQRPEVFEQFKLPDPMTRMMLEGESGAVFVGMMNMSMDRAIGLLQPEEEKLRQKLLKAKDSMIDDLKNLTSPAQCEPYAILGHGDCWVNNFIYSYKNGVPTEIVLLDWQICRYVSPALDLLYFIFGCTDGEFRRKHYDEMIRLYHRSLTELLEKLGGDPTRQFPYTALLRQLKQHGKFGLFMAIFMVPMLCVDNADLPDMDAQAEKYKETKESGGMEELDNEWMQMMTKSEDKYRKRMGDVLRDLARFGYI
ncbi:conserved hypothetical protein [Culex quinquefasciatus]|uniref:CHK kinase-like domain-containing protein n=1 Tax=Culex quinquefasciatus TaxID=7176 RepID=B0XJW2_CULQU|nr:conserved hypothetical protein [Culex quinquefasciatus]|eukprot:XP_001869934.1 conserved hypothetical protein [Culex quinquefasciatus]